MVQNSSQSRFEDLAQLVAARTGIVIQRTPEDFERATRRAMEKLALGSLDELVGRLRAGSGWDALIDEVTVGETYFFRNPEHFELVRDALLPAIERERPVGHVLRVWSAGCASGEEAYSLAIMLRELGLLDSARVYGTDVSALALGKAQAACYRDWAFRAADESLRALYFCAEPAGQTLRDTIRARVSFRRLNLASDDYLVSLGDSCAMDLIFCRNVLIYFDADTIAHVEKKLFEALAPGGWLITGPSDPVLGQRAPFEVVSTARGTCYRRPTSLAAALPSNSPVAAAVEAGAGPPPRALGRPAVAVPRRVPPAPELIGQHALANAAFAHADYTRVIEVASLHPSDLPLAVLRVRARWNQDGAVRAECACREALAEHGLDTELRYLHAVALLECRRLPEALRAVEKVLYLDRALLIAHFTHGSILERMHDPEAARRAYRNAYDGSRSRPSNEVLAFADGVVAGGLAAASGRALAALLHRPRERRVG